MQDSRHVEESIKHSIRKNGFPEKAVRLPFKPVFEACKQHGVPLTDVLNHLKEEEIFGRIQGNSIEFRSCDQPPQSPEGSPAKNFGDLDLSGLNMTDPAAFQEQARQAMTNLTPEQMEEIRKMVEQLSDEDKREILKMFTERMNPGSGEPPRDMG